VLLHVAFLHVHAYDEVAPILTSAGCRVIILTCEVRPTCFGLAAPRSGNKRCSLTICWL
jgi:hypothetical protein